MSFFKVFRISAKETRGDGVAFFQGLSYFCKRNPQEWGSIFSRIFTFLQEEHPRGGVAFSEECRISARGIPRGGV